MRSIKNKVYYDSKRYLKDIVLEKSRNKEANKTISDVWAMVSNEVGRQLREIGR